MTRLARAALGMAVAVSTSGCAGRRTPPAPDPASAHRFQIATVGDSTFAFVIASQRWVHTGMEGIAVDPRRRDVLVARFVVSRVAGDTAEAMVTGQTARVADAHVALLWQPRVSVTHRPSFWAGFFGGAALGAAIALVLQ